MGRLRGKGWLRLNRWSEGKGSYLFALGGVMFQKSAMETSSFTNALGPFDGGEFGKADGVNVHGIGARGDLRG